MSLPVFVWVLDHSEATLGARLVLLVLAEHAHDDGRESYPSIDTIARRTRLSRKGARDALRRLEADGYIESDGVGPRGQTKWRVHIGGIEATRVAATPVYLGAENGEATTPEPTTKEPSNKRPSAQEDLPDGFPPDFLTPLAEVMEHLTAAASAKGAALPARASVAKAMMKRPLKPWVQVAEAVEHWLVYGKGQRIRGGDVVARWRTWCDDEPDAAPALAPAARSRAVRLVPPQKLEAKSQAERQGLQEWVAENVPDLPASQALGAAQRIQYAGQELTADRVRAYLEQATS